MAITNIALNKATTGSNFVKPFAPSKCVDGKLTPLNRWLCNNVSGTNPAKLTVDLVKPSVINSWTVRHMGAVGWASPAYNMCDFKLQGSTDNVNWTDIDSVVGNTMSITTRTLSVPVVYRYARLSVSKGLSKNIQLASVVELEINGFTTPYLSGLGVNVNNVPLILSPVFAPTTATYTTANVPYSTASCNIVTIAQDPTANIKVNNVTVTSGASTPVNLNMGSNAISVVVTAADGVSVQPYTVTIVREQGAVLTNLSISSGALTPVFSSAVLNYSSPNVGFDTSSVNVTPTTTVAGTTIAVNGVAATSGQATAAALNVGSNTINCVATNGTASQTYSITSVRASNPYLESVAGITGITFVSTTYSYTTSVVNGTNRVKVTPKSVDSSATITVNNVVVPSGSSSASIPLVVGSNTVTIVVKSASGSDSKTYTFAITRLP